MKKIKYGVILFMSTVIFCTVCSERIVMTNSGPVRGKTITLPESEVEAFLGIPFAQPPVGKLRFRKPLPVKPWDDVFNATTMCQPCCQNATGGYYWLPKTENMTEDCLYLNIWVPMKNQQSGPKTVLVWIHGGAFNLGSANMDLYNGTILADYGDVIVTSINYRIGVFGYLTAFIDDAPGNMGMYDQVLALQWLKNNIKYFGGDPNEIVLIGESAGSMSIGGHLLSPMTRDLFKRAIMESGSAIHPMGNDNKYKLLSAGNTLAKLVECADDEVNLNTHPQLVIDCLKRLPSRTLSNAEGIMMKTNPLTFFPRWGDEYLPTHPSVLMSKAKFKECELLIGITKDEGSLFLTVVLPEYFGVYGQNGTERVSKRLAHSFIRTIFSFTEQRNVTEIADFYIKRLNNYSTPYVKKALYDSLGDYLITCSTYFYANFFSQGKAPVYFFRFSQRPSNAKFAKWAGVAHFDEVQYVFGNPLRKDKNYSTSDEVLSVRIMDRWLAFAKTGNPNIPREVLWPPYTAQDPLYLDISLEETIKLQPDESRCEFWLDRFQARMNFAKSEFLHSNARKLHTAYYHLITIGILIVFLHMVLKQ